jgi:hypothetical protein
MSSGDKGSLPTVKKKSALDSRTTLDNLHHLQMNDFQENRGEVEDLQAKLQVLQGEIDETADIIEKTQKEEQVRQVKNKLKRWETNTPVYEYFFETGDILFNYYDLQEKIQKGGMSGTGKVMKAKPGSVLAALQDGEDTSFGSSFVTQDRSAPRSAPHEGREVLLDKYLRKVNPEHAKSSIQAFDDPYGTCDVCESEMTFSANEALFFCPACGHQEFVLIDSDKPSYKDPPREVTYYAYKRINHFNELLAQFQAKESTDIPEDVFQAILEELKKERITNTEHLKPTKIREILKKLKCTNFYEHVPYILNRINGNKAPVMTREVEEKLRFMFKEIQSSFIKHCPKNRSNFLSYSYVLYKFCELLELDDYLQCFPLLKNRDKLYNQDKIWQLICKDMGWEFIRSI